MVALGLMFYVLAGKMELPFRLPGILIAVVLGSLLYNILGFGGYVADFQAPSFTLQFSLPRFSVGFFSALPETLKYLPLAIPFGIITIIGGINNTESARLAGDTYRARSILLTEAFSTLIAAFFGGVAQTTPYIGHPAYKKMGATKLVHACNRPFYRAWCYSRSHVAHDRADPESCPCAHFYFHRF